MSEDPHNHASQEIRGSLTDIRATLKQVDARLHQLEVQLRAGAQPVSAVPSRLSVEQTWFLALAGLTALLVIGVRLFRLGSLQTDLYGDIEIVYHFVERVGSGQWPFGYVLGVGPIYHYIILPVIALTGLNYYGLKLSAVITSLGALLATFALAHRLIDKWFALLAVAIAGVSSWLLIFSRLGISLIFVPLLVMISLWLIVRIAQDHRPADVVLCAAISTLGLYSYPQSFVLAAVAFLTLLCLRWSGHPISWSTLRRFVVVSLIVALPFMWMFFRSPEGFTHGYIGSKFFTEENPFRALARNILAAALAYHVKGDSIFRSNPMYLPHLDRLSGLFFLAGIAFWLRPAYRRWSPVLLVPFVLLHLPSILVLGRPGEVPSAGRTVGAAPIAYILIASGMWWLLELFARRGWQRLGQALAALLLVTIFVLNMQRYFVSYIDGLPYHDTSIGGRIALYADSLPPETQVYVVGCCWEGGMPELPFVQIVASRPENLHGLEPQDLTCEGLAKLSEPAMLIWSFHEPVPAQLSACSQWLPAQLYMSPKGLPVFYAAPLLNDRE